MSNDCKFVPVNNIIGSVQSVTERTNHFNLSILTETGDVLAIRVCKAIMSAIEIGDRLCIEFGRLRSERTGRGNFQFVDAVVAFKVTTVDG